VVAPNLRSQDGLPTLAVAISNYVSAKSLADGRADPSSLGHSPKMAGQCYAPPPVPAYGEEVCYA
jgi:hypothetical protein